MKSAALNSLLVIGSAALSASCGTRSEMAVSDSTDAAVDMGTHTDGCPSEIPTAGDACDRECASCSYRCPAGREYVSATIVCRKGRWLVPPNACSYPSGGAVPLYCLTALGGGACMGREEGQICDSKVPNASGCTMRVCIDRTWTDQPADCGCAAP